MLGSPNRIVTCARNETLGTKQASGNDENEKFLFKVS